ncbi:MAG: tRNA uridine-5-carboxymethylaminomethyl(34) synthesis GTPase MnmE [Candidatus Omnitrophica bacterium]|nr:tRNA uridine-5-carboxymethylaminomethyl(34) synthesis GTPase MnmE [Candidatus Omnitrophota bacterium]
MGSIRLDDTIVAVSTPIGEGGIGIVRLSGKDALGIADRIFLSKDGETPSRFKTYTVHYGHIVENAQCPPQKMAGPPMAEIIDEVILTVMRAPRSYTKEDVVEINCHSGIVPLKKILDLVMRNEARLAEPGEFTKRAFLNGRIDILQAESVLDIIRAKTDLSLKAAVNNLGGLFSKKIDNIRNELVGILAHIEATIDFSEEDDVDTLRKKDIFKKLAKIKKEIEKLISTADEGKVLRQGIKAVICGSPNVGKSSLMNVLLNEPRAIVTHIPGTTRDTIEEVVNIKGIPVILVDTAGISSTNHPAEKEGVERSYSSIKRADLVIFLLDYGRKMNRHDLKIIQNIKDKNNTIIVINKNDLRKNIDIGLVRKFFPKRPIVYVSALNLQGIDKLENKIRDMIFKGRAPSPDFISISNDRQLGKLRSSLDDIKTAVDSLRERVSIDCVSICVRSSIESLGEIIGDTVTEEALDKIFSEFCIGK